MRSECLSLLEKNLLGSIACLDGGRGCFAGNAYLGKLFSSTPEAVGQSLAHLERLGFIRIESPGANRRLRFVRYPSTTDNIYKDNISLNNNIDNIYKDNISNNLNNNIDNISKDNILSDYSNIDNICKDNISGDEPPIDPELRHAWEAIDYDDPESADRFVEARDKAIREGRFTPPAPAPRRLEDTRPEPRALLYRVAEGFSDKEDLRAAVKAYADMRLAKSPSYSAFELSAMLQRLRIEARDEQKQLERIKYATEAGKTVI